jgi:predicted phage terminase large subunit-like protein
MRTFPATKDKEARAKPASAQAQAGNIKLVCGRWNAQFLDELENFPEGAHDDQVDALSGAFNEVTPTS